MLWHAFTWLKTMKNTQKSPIISEYCYKVIQDFMVTGLFAGQYNTKLHTIVGSALLRD